MTTRRDFLRQTALLGAGLTISPFFIKAGSAGVGANDKIGVGLIGCNGMGFEDLKAFLRNPEVECIALSDIDENVLNNRAAETEKITGKKVKHLYKDWRKLIDNKDIDLVIVGTPDHWHCLQMVSACQAGKDVYCEKPLGNSIEECNIMVRAAQKYNRVVQVGQWQRSDPHWQDAMAFVHGGQLGKIRTVRVFSYQGWCPSIPVKPDEAVPAGVDYDMWLGPAPRRPFNRNRFHFTFRWFWDYAGGLMTDWGVHLLDYALYGMNVTAPESIMASGGKFGYPDDACETPDLLQTIYTFKDFTVMWDHAIGIDDGLRTESWPRIRWRERYLGDRSWRLGGYSGKGKRTGPHGGCSLEEVIRRGWLEFACEESFGMYQEPEPELQCQRRDRGAYRQVLPIREYSLSHG